MIIKNKKNGTNVLAFRGEVENVRVIIRAGEVVNIPNLVDFDQVINKADFENRGWFEIINEENKVETVSEKKETNLERAKKEVEEYASNKKTKNN